METINKIDKYIDEAVIPANPMKKRAFDDYKKYQKEASSILNIFKTKLRNHQNRFFQESELDLNYVDDIKYLVNELKDLNDYFK